VAIPVIPAISEIRRIRMKPAGANSSRTLSRKKKKKKPITKKGLVEWLKVLALSSNPSISKQKQKQKQKTDFMGTVR
jgi:hypothetical protein